MEMQNVNRSRDLFNLPDFVFGNDPCGPFSAIAEEVDIRKTGRIRRHQARTKESSYCLLAKREIIDNHHLARSDVTAVADEMALDKFCEGSLAQNS